jgi:hypothetical protein
MKVAKVEEQNASPLRKNKPQAKAESPPKDVKKIKQTKPSSQVLTSKPNERTNFKGKESKLAKNVNNSSRL